MQDLLLRWKNVTIFGRNFGEKKRKSIQCESFFYTKIKKSEMAFYAKLEANSDPLLWFMYFQLPTFNHNRLLVV